MNQTAGSGGDEGLPGPLEKARYLLAYLHTQGPEGYEKSVKMMERALFGNRFLVGMPIRQWPSAKLLDVCAKLDMPREFVARIESELAEATTIHFGFEEGAGSAIFKLYLEYGNRLSRALQAGDETVLLHRAFKWDALNSGTRAIASYLCHPRLSHEQAMHAISRIYKDETDHPALRSAIGLLQLAAARTREPPMYLEVSEEGNPRVSFDVNFHAAGLTIADIEPQLRDMCHHYRISEEQLMATWNGAAQQAFGHLSGGISRDRQDFLTIYYDAGGQWPA